MAQMKSDNPKHAFRRAMRRLCGRGGIVPVAAAVFIVVVACIGFALIGRGSSSGVELKRSSQGDVQQAAQGSDAREAAVPNTEPEQSVPVPLYVHVDGAVASPGVYAIDAGSRVNDAVTAAGGLAEGADTSSLNLAAPVQDGSKVSVPFAGEAQGDPNSTGSVGEPQSYSGVAPSSGSSGSSLVNINSATADELKTLPGVGDATAEAILEDRRTNGPFTSIEDLMRVFGIGEKKFAKLKEKICV